MDKMIRVYTTDEEECTRFRCTCTKADVFYKPFTIRKTGTIKEIGIKKCFVCHECGNYWEIKCQ